MGTATKDLGFQEVRDPARAQESLSQDIRAGLPIRQVWWEVL